VFTLTFATFIGSARDWHLPGAPFVLASLLLVIGIAIAWRITRHEPVPA
jgi:DHA1 family tetracycline resistance protein-like MFS transporter